MSVMDFPFGSSAIPGVTGIIRIFGTPFIFAYGSVSVPADDSAAVAVVFSPIFPTAVIMDPVFGINTGASSVPVIVVPYSYNVTAAGFTLAASGGAPGSSVTVSYLVLGY